MGHKVVTLDATRGAVLVSADLHGHWDDFARLRELFLAGGYDYWVSVGDWVHGPPPLPAERHRVRDRDGAPLYDYPDRSADILRALFDLMDRHPGRVLSILGNHEHAHVGGPRTRKFHDDEPAHLEAQLSAAEVAELRRRFASWPMMVRLPACGVVVTHGALAPALDGAADLERVRYDGDNDARAAELLSSAMRHYGYTDDGDVRLLERLADPGGPPYELLVHGHDRDEEGWSATGRRALLLCTSFGARRDRKTYLRLDLSRRYRSLGDLREGFELLRLWS